MMSVEVSGGDNTETGRPSCWICNGNIPSVSQE